MKLIEDFDQTLTKKLRTEAISITGKILLKIPNL